MAGWTTYEDLLTELKKERFVQRIPFAYVNGSVVSPAFATLWRRGPTPAVGTTPTNGLAGAVATSSATVGALPLINAPTGKTNFLVALKLASQEEDVAGSFGQIMLCDRLAHANINVDAVSGAFSPVIDGTSRLATGEGGLILVEVTTALSNIASNVISLTYTDQGGASSTTPAFPATTGAQAVERIPSYSSQWFIPLASGDSGARTITNWIFTSGTQTGAITISIIKPICVVGFPFESAVSRDFVMMGHSMHKIPNNACLFFLVGNGSGATRDFNLTGELVLIAG